MGKGPKCRIQVQDLSGEKPRSVASFTFNMDAEDARSKIESSFPRILLVKAKEKKAKEKKQVLEEIIKEEEGGVE